MRDLSLQKAAYRFLDNEAVSHDELSRPHWEQTRIRAGQYGKTVLQVLDIPELDYMGIRTRRGWGRSAIIVVKG
jgi:hypothetical protein